MEPEYLKLCSPNPASDLHPEQPESNLQRIYLKYIILTSHLYLGYQSDPFFVGSFQQIYFAFLIFHTFFLISVLISGGSHKL